jgi:hypothetical protein
MAGGRSKNEGAEKYLQNIDWKAWKQGDTR